MSSLTGSGRAHRSWIEMRQRCLSPNKTNFSNYGGKGIGIAPEWESFDTFYQDLGPRPEGTSLGRIDNSKGYCKNNCRWETVQEQNSNKGTYKNNSSGIKLVSFVSSIERWRAYASVGNGRTKVLLTTPDFFLACCARKSWEVNQGVK